LVVYFLLTCIYSWRLKRLVLVDCITLAFLYAVRVLAGAAAVGHQLSFWLLAFSVFLFMSLAFVKRYAELESQRSSGLGSIHGRGYHTADAPLIQTMGIAAGQVAVLVLALYLNSDAVLVLYRSPEIVWGGVLILLFWINWVWVQAHRGNMHDDPLIFAIKDRVSLVTGALFSVVLTIGAVGLRW
jgi:4-hydroxybenzoate polyprenyltransferase